MTRLISFRCPACGAALTLPADTRAAVSGPCPHCRQTITGPTPDNPPAPSPRPQAQAVAPRPQPHTPPPPAPTPAPPQATPAPVRSRAIAEPISTGNPRPHYGFITSISILSCALAAVIAFAAGYRTATQEILNRPLAIPVPLPPRPPKSQPTPAKTPPAPPAPEIPQTIPKKDTPAPASDPPPKPKPPAQPKPPAPSSPQEAALHAFLTAPTWASRLAHVITPQDVRDEMADHASTHGDGQIPFTSISLLQETESHHVFLLRTPSFPSGFPVVVAGSTQQGWLVDWPAFREFHSDAFKHFADEKPAGQASFRLLIQPASGPPSQNGIARFRLSPPMPGRERIANVEEGSTAHEKIRQLLESQENSNPAAFRDLMASGGLPLILSISKRPAPANHSTPALWIEEIQAIGWKPEPPPANR